MKTILFFTPKISPPVAEKLAGVYAAAHARGWTVRPIELERTKRRAAEFIRLWRPDGVLVECADLNPIANVRDLRGLPVVWIDRDPSLGGGLVATLNVSATADLACAELLKAKPAALAFVGWHTEVWWSSLRAQELKARATAAQLPFLESPSGSWNPDAYAGEDLPLRAFLRDLPEGTGIFAANDQVAERVIAAAQQERRTVPGDLFVVGADNDLFLCENFRPSITSVAPNFRHLGEIAVELLDRRIGGGGGRGATRPTTTRAQADPRGIVSRESSRPVRVLDARLGKALELIRREATDGLSVPQVVAAMGCSRRLAEIQFRKSLGHTILDEIQAVRLEHVLELLSHPDQAIEPIANLCGWQSSTTLARVFRQHYGMTLSAWRAQNGRQGPAGAKWPPLSASCRGT